MNNPGLYVALAVCFAQTIIIVLLIRALDRAKAAADHDGFSPHAEVREADARLQRHPKATEHPQSNAAPSQRSPAR